MPAENGGGTRATPRLGSRRVAVGALAVALLVGAIALALGAAGRTGAILPGVRALGVDLGGMTVEQATSALEGALPAASEVVLRDAGDPGEAGDDRTWSVHRGELGLGVDPGAVARRAHGLGRGALGPLAAAWIRLRGHEVTTQGLFQPETARAALERLAPLVDLAPVEGDVRLVDAQLQVREPKSGRQLDVEATLARLAAASVDPWVREVELATRGTAPRFSDVTAVAEAYRVAVSGPVRMTWRQGQTFAVDERQLARWVDVTLAPNAVGDLVPAIVFDEAAIADWIEGLRPQIDRLARNARLSYDALTGRVAVIERSQPGQTLDVAASVRRLVAAAGTDVRTAELVVDTKQAAVGADAVARLQGKVRVLVAAATRLTGQPSVRGLNILLASERLDGVTVAPGEAFSLVEALGPVEAAAGFDMASIGSAGSVLDGGLEQVATGFYRAALWAGLVIVERHAPPWRAAWVEPPIGLDAAVSPPEGDLRFVNDTDGPLVFGCWIDAGRGVLEVRVVGAPPARRVTLGGPIVQDLSVPLEPAVRVDPSVAAGQRVQVRWGRHGGLVSYQRVVRDGSSGAELFRDAIVSRYEPSGDLTLVDRAP